MARIDLLQIRRDTAANWTSVNPVLALGEPGLETDTNQIKYGDGSTAWNALAYAGGGSVASVTGTADRITSTGGATPVIDIDAAYDAAVTAEIAAAIAPLAPLASPALTGTPTAPTPSGGDNDTSIATTAFVQGELTGKSDSLLTFRTEVASHTLDATDLASINAGESLNILMNVAGANDFTVPPNATQAFPVGAVIMVTQIGAGETTIVAGSGVTIVNTDGLEIAGQGGTAGLFKTATNTWYAFGKLKI